MIYLAVLYVLSIIYTFAGYSFSGYGSASEDKLAPLVVIDVGMTALLSPMFLAGGILELFFGPLEEI